MAATPSTRERRRDALESSVCRRGIASVSASNAQLQLPVDGHDLLGLLRTSGRVTMFDLEVLAWITERWVHRSPPSEAELTRDQEWTTFTLYEMGRDLYSREPGGKERRLIRSAFRRLTGLELDVIGYDARRRVFRATAGVGRLLRNIQSDYDDLGEDPEPGAIGALRGSTFEARLDDWMIDSLRQGNITYLRSSVLRELSALAKRLWILLEAEAGQDAGAVRECALILDERVYTTLGMSYGVERQARAAVKRAIGQIATVDPRYSQLALEKQGGVWSIAVKTNVAQLLGL